MKANKIAQWDNEKDINLSVSWGGSLKDTIKTIERSLIEMALSEFRTKTRAAKVLGVNRMTINRKLKEKNL